MFLDQKTRNHLKLFKKYFWIPQATLHMMTDIEDEDDWATSDELADDDNDSNAVVAESALDRWVLLDLW